MSTANHHQCSCHDNSHYSSLAAIDIGRRRFVRLAALGGGITLLGLATPWRLARAEAGHGGGVKPQVGQSSAAKPQAGHDADPRAGAAPAHATEALLLSCMDYRLIDDTVRYMDGRGLTNQYDHVILAGASLGVLNNQFKNWSKTFWEHLKVAIDLHHIKRVILMDHRDCGAYKVILQADFSKDLQMETRIHGKFLRELMVAIHKTYPELEVERLLMNLDGTVQKIT